MTEDVQTDFLRDIAQNREFKVDQTEAQNIHEHIQEQLRIVNKLNDVNLDPTTPADREYTFADTDPNNVFINKCDIKQNYSGKIKDLDIGIKDNISVGGIPMTCGSPALKNHIPNQDATVVQRILRHGGRIVGKTNMDEFALGGDESTMRYKTTSNPHSKSRHPGGSSLGSGVGVAEGVFDIGLGTDTGGSVRIPASWSGLFGLKPTGGSVPLDGVVQYSKTLDTVGILASNAKQCMVVFSAISDTTEAVSRDQLSRWDEGRSEFLSSLSIGLVSSLFGDHSKIDAKVSQTLDLLRDKGVTIKEVSVPNSEFIVPCWMAISTTEFGAYLDTRAVPYWSDSSPLFSLFDHLSSRSHNSDGEIGKHIRDVWLSAIVLREQFGEEYYAVARQLQNNLRESVSSLFENVDLLVSPTVPMTPPLLKDGFGDVSKVIKNPGLFNLTGHPSISAPCGRLDNLPVGVQFTSQYNQEDLICRLASCLPESESV
jgi:Asp-tRNA(Asn)/Glu-tRNA(Gln) amidotransferase A subunit family amidase